MMADMLMKMDALLCQWANEQWQHEDCSCYCHLKKIGIERKGEALHLLLIGKSGVKSQDKTAYFSLVTHWKLPGNEEVLESQWLSMPFEHQKYSSTGHFLPVLLNCPSLFMWVLMKPNFVKVDFGCGCWLESHPLWSAKSQNKKKSFWTNAFNYIHCGKLSTKIKKRKKKTFWEFLLQLQTLCSRLIMSSCSDFLTCILIWHCQI